MISLSEEKQSQVIEAFNSKLRYLADLLNIDNKYFDGLISQIYPSELQLNRAVFLSILLNSFAGKRNNSI